MACLFLCSTYLEAQDLKFETEVQKAYQFVLNLQPKEALSLLKDKKTSTAHYVSSLAESLELLLTEDATLFNEYEDHFQDRLELKTKGTEAEYQFLQAEIRLQWAFVYLKFGHEFDAALNLRQAYQIADECRRKNPNFLPIRKTTGLLEIIIGSVPEKYNWVLGLLGMEGSVQDGLKDLETARTSSSAIAFESDLLFSLTQGFVFQQPDTALAEVIKLSKDQADNRLLLFLGTSLALKNSQSEQALTFINRLEENGNGLQLYYADYLKGEIYLHKADYLNAISAYRWFINNYKGQNYIKDAYYKIALCYWLNGNQNDAKSAFNDAKTKGKESAEADKHAARSLADKELPNIKLSKARYFTDGGYYREAALQLEEIIETDIPTKRDAVEFNYRKARLAHKQKDTNAAKTFYLQTIEKAGEENWYFAPNSYLQLGYIAVAENKPDEAKQYFNKALDYKKHEYKNSIDSKAKSALAQINRK